MAITVLEGFDDGLWGNRIGGSITAADVGSSYGLHGNGAKVGDVVTRIISLPTPVGELFTLGFAFNADSIGGGGNLIDMGNYVRVGIDTSGNRAHLMILASSTPDLDLYSANGSVSEGEWHYIEVQMLFDISSAGTAKWWLDGELLDYETGIDYTALNNTTLNIGDVGSSDIDILYVDDIYMTDTSGTVNTGELGPIEVVTLLPNGNGNSSDMVGSDGNSVDNYLLVDNNAATPPATTEYVESSTEGDKDTYAMGNLTGTPTVYGMSASLFASKDDTEAKFVRPLVRTGAVDYVGDSTGLAESYSLHEYIWDENPDTSTDWTYGDINGMEVGQEVRNS